jgi:hypothetical protein
METRVARWHIFKPKFPVWVNFEGFCNGRFWSILWPFYLFYGHLVYFIVIWYIFPRFGMLYLLRKILQPWWQPFVLSIHSLSFGLSYEAWQWIRPLVRRKPATFFCPHPNYRLSKCRHSKCLPSKCQHSKCIPSKCRHSKCLPSQCQHSKCLPSKCQHSKLWPSKCWDSNYRHKRNTLLINLS